MMQNIKFISFLAGFLVFGNTIKSQEDCLGSSRIYVSPNGSDSSGTGSSAEPFQSIQLAVDTACVGDTILLLPGTYYDNVDVVEKDLTIGSFQMVSEVDIDPELVLWEGNVAASVYASNCEIHVVGIHFDNASTAFQGNNTTNSSIEHCLVTNSGSNGSAVREFYGTGFKVSHSTFTSNGNACLYIVRHFGFTIEHCVFTNNVAKAIEYVGMDWTDGFEAMSSISDCLVSGNTGYNHAGGILVDNGGHVKITNSTIIDNKFGLATSSGSSSRVSTIYLMNSIVQGNDQNGDLMMSQANNASTRINARHSIIGDLEEGYDWETVYSIIDVDETVLDGPAYLDEDGHLLPVSPAIGSGATQVEWEDGAISNISALDLAGNNRPMPEGSLPDMGCYESELGTPLPISGCMTPEACNYDPFAVEDDGSCNLPGCLNEAACNYDPATTCDGGEAACIMPGCTDEEACNYDANAACSGGECYYGEAGCDDPYACNYVSDAVCVDLMLCDYSCCPGPGCCDVGTVWSGGKCVISPNCRFDFDLSGDVNLQDLLLFLAHYETTCVVNP